jgi:pyrimidine-nucleoside phosphorylase
MSGRGLGHTGGTLDKLESIPGYRVDLTIDEFKRVLRSVGTSIIGQTASLVPADQKLYALRDVTGTVEAIPLLASSIMSKKIAEGSDALVLDVKTGDGAFMKTVDASRALATAMVALGRHAGVRTEAIISDMNTPLGRGVGNAIEIIECIETLKGQGPGDLVEVVTRVGARMLVLGGVDGDAASAATRVGRALASGAGLQAFARLIEAQGGNARVIEDYRLLPSAPDRELFRAPRSGFLVATKADAIGRASNALGAGRNAVGEPVDHAVGIVLLADQGAEVRAGQPLVELHHRSGRGLAAALTLVREGVTIGDAPPPSRPRVIADIT